MNPTPDQIWNSRYEQNEFVYGEEPNVFFAEHLPLITKGKVLFSAEGEGRNAVYAATQGLESFAFDISSAGRDKALQLAKSKGISIDYQVTDALRYLNQPESMDGLVIIFNHFPKRQQGPIFAHILKMLKPTGKVIFQCFSEGHLNYRDKSNVGGPSEIDLLYNIQDVQTYFQSFRTMHLVEHEVLLKEGKYHDGLGLVISGIFEK
ncbi:MAG: hypothetical protein RLY35_846 [Bacteroidota bacterium]